MKVRARPGGWWAAAFVRAAPRAVAARPPPAISSCRGVNSVGGSHLCLTPCTRSSAMVSSKECNVHDGVAEGCAALALRWRRRDPSLAYHMLYDITGLISINMTETTRKWLDRTNRGIMSPSEQKNWVPYPELRRAADVHRERAPSSDARLCLDIGGARMPPRRDLDFTWMLVMMGIPFGKIWNFAKLLRKRGLGNWLLLEDAPAAAAATAGAAAAAAAADPPRQRGVMVFNEFKTDGSYDPFTFELPDDLRDACVAYLHARPADKRGFLFVHPTSDQPFESTAEFNSFFVDSLRAVFPGKEVDLNLLRHSFVSHFLSNPDITGLHAKWYARAMGHSLETQWTYKRLPMEAQAAAAAALEELWRQRLEPAGGACAVPTLR